jgi:hypothetical protein
MAIGANRRYIIRLVMREGLWFTLASVGLGLTGAMAILIDWGTDELSNQLTQN